MSKKRTTKSSVADLKAQVRHEVNVQRLFDQFAAISVEKCLEVNTRTLESWLVVSFYFFIAVGVADILEIM